MMARFLRSWMFFGMMSLLAVLGSACGDGGSSSNPPLFQDSFSSAFPGTTWTGPTLTGAASAGFDPTTGSLMMMTTGATASAVTTTTATFNNPSLTFSLTMGDLSAATTQLGVGTVTILNATPASVAFASWDNATGRITFHINGGTDAQSAVLVADGTIHRLVFSVNSAGVAIWTLDSGAALVTQPLPGGMLRLQLWATFGTGTAWPVFFFDNVAITSP